jgi:hypothetical protein
MVIRFYCIHQAHKKKTTPIRGLSSGHHVQEAIEVLQTAFGWKIHSHRCPALFLVIREPLSGSFGVAGLRLAPPCANCFTDLFLNMFFPCWSCRVYRQWHLVCFVSEFMLSTHSWGSFCLTPKISGPFWWILALKYVLIDMWAKDQNEMMFLYFQL